MSAQRGAVGGAVRADRQYGFSTNPLTCIAEAVFFLFLSYCYVPCMFNWDVKSLAMLPSSVNRQLLHWSRSGLRATRSFSSDGIMYIISLDYKSWCINVYITLMLQLLKVELVLITLCCWAVMENVPRWDLVKVEIGISKSQCSFCCLNISFRLSWANII